MHEPPRAPRIPTALYGITGMPLGHSLSPLIHNRAFEIAGIPAAYLAWEKSPESLPAFMHTVRELPVSGLSVTIPHKQAILEHVDVLSENAHAVGAVNTLYWSKDSLVGENTDVAGFIAPLRKLSRIPSSALILGAGGVARAVLKGLADIGVEKTFVSARDENKAQKPCSDFRASFIHWDERSKVSAEAELIVNATPLGMSGKYEALSPLSDDSGLSSGQIVYDLIYNPLKTRLLRQAEHRGCRTVEGLEMFIGQAAEQFRLWTKREFPLREISPLLKSVLQNRNT